VPRGGLGGNRGRGPPPYKKGRENTTSHPEGGEEKSGDTLHPQPERKVLSGKRRSFPSLEGKEGGKADPHFCTEGRGKRGLGEREKEMLGEGSRIWVKSLGGEGEERKRKVSGGGGRKKGLFYLEHGVGKRGLRKETRRELSGRAGKIAA